MKNITTALFALGLLTASNSPALADDAELVLTVSSITNHQGALMVAVFDSEEAWNGGAPVAGARIDVNTDTASASLIQGGHCADLRGAEAEGFGDPSNDGVDVVGIGSDDPRGQGEKRHGAGAEGRGWGHGKRNS